jgi:hypothetical protein
MLRRRLLRPSRQRPIRRRAMERPPMDDHPIPPGPRRPPSRLLHEPPAMRLRWLLPPRLRQHEPSRTVERPDVDPHPEPQPVRPPKPSFTASPAHAALRSPALGSASTSRAHREPRHSSSNTGKTAALGSAARVSVATSHTARPVKGPLCQPDIARGVQARTRADSLKWDTVGRGVRSAKTLSSGPLRRVVTRMVRRGQANCWQFGSRAKSNRRGVPA